MTAAYEIPLTPEAASFPIALGGTSYQLTIFWNRAASTWVINLASADGTTPILSGIPLVTGTDLLSQYQYLGIAGSLTVQSDGDIDAMPTLDNLGTQSHLYFITG